MLSQLERAVSIARDVGASAARTYPQILGDDKFHDFSFLKKLCEVTGARVIEDEVLPSPSMRAAVIDVAGVPFIVLADTLVTTGDRLIALAHELSHALLEHLKRPNFSVQGYSEAMRFADGALQMKYTQETELEADLLGMMLVMSDTFLHRVVQDTIFIPTPRLSSEKRLPLEWVAARVQLYREMYGYTESRRLLRLRHSDPFSLTDHAKWFECELIDEHYLERFVQDRLFGRTAM